MSPKPLIPSVGLLMILCLFQFTLNLRFDLHSDAFDFDVRHFPHCWYSAKTDWLIVSFYFISSDVDTRCWFLCQVLSVSIHIVQFNIENLPMPHCGRKYTVGLASSLITLYICWFTAAPPQLPLHTTSAAAHLFGKATLPLIFFFLAFLKHTKS